MELIDEPLQGVKIFKPFVFEDTRGVFVKPFHEDQLVKLGIKFDVKEEFFSTSTNNVLRGMHFQLPPYAHSKLVYCISGKVWDVLLDLRPSSATYMKSVGFELSSQNRYCVYIPKGVAHGFLSQEDRTCLVYKTDVVHQPEFDAGVSWDSFAFDWPLADEVIISSRDETHPRLNDFVSPF